MKTIKWKTVSVELSKIKPTPNNFKLKTEDGTARFKESVKSYGLAGAVILNADFTLIDGNTRVQQAKEMGLKKIDASMPDRKLTPKEFTEFAAMYDMARAGEVDILRIKDELGTSKDFFKKWGFDIPEKQLAQIGKLDEAAITPKQKVEQFKKAEEESTRVTLLFNSKEAEEYIKLCEAMYKHFKVDNVTDLSLAALRSIKKQLKIKI
jgi:hypothetical protein